jgi:hypothetical protein
MATRLASISCAVSFVVGLNTANRINCQVRFPRRHTQYISLKAENFPLLRPGYQQLLSVFILNLSMSSS